MKLIVNVAKNWAIGRDGDLLFKIPEDLAFFRDTTINKIVVMGHKTLLAMPNSKPLKNRINIVLSRDQNLIIEGCTICNSLEELFKELEKYNADDVYIVGGGRIYENLLQYCSEAIVTKVDEELKADTYFPNLDENDNWKMTWVSNDSNYDGLNFRFTKYENTKLEYFKNSNF